MYKYYSKNRYNIMYYRFDSLTEYLDHLEKCQINYRIFPSPASIERDGAWSGTNTYEEAVELCKYGYHENFDKLINLKLNLEKYVKMDMKKTKQFNYYIGYAPDVKAYLEGHPLSMLNKEEPKRKRIDIWFNTCFNCATAREKVYNRGAITLVLTEILETLGYNVNLHLYNLTTSDNQMYYADYLLKNESERINCQKLYFPMCNTAWLRRLFFRSVEGTPEVNPSWNYGYGTPAGEELIRRTFDLDKKDIVIAQPSEMNIEGRDIIEDANNMFDIINRSSERDFKLERIKQLSR